jgi:hypothetical protein
MEIDSWAMQLKWSMVYVRMLEQRHALAAVDSRLVVTKQIHTTSSIQVC